MTTEDRIELIMLNFTMLAEHMAELAKSVPSKSIIKLNATVNGMEIGAAIMAKETA